MMSEVKALAKGDVYRDFEVLDVVALPELSGEGIWLRHRRLGMEIFHLVNGDEENLFAFAFKTPPSDSTGVAHILEHSVLCGSKNYPLKDPFIRLANQSVKTFLNAMTFSDKTVYPAASVSRKDYFNLMAVYGDAVFFPLLEEWTFEQEAHRLELDSEGLPAIQGVVYNEMKGNYSNFENVAGDWAVRSVLSGTVYDLDSGGDPVEIPRLTYAEFVAFHRKHYNPGNCRLFLAGNISTGEQIDFITERFLDKWEESAGGCAVVSDSISGNVSGSSSAASAARNKCSASLADSVGKKLLPLDEPPAAFAHPVALEKPGPGGDGCGADSGANVTVTWFLGDSSDPVRYMEAVLLAEILMGHDGSPLSRALLESALGEDLAPNCGLDSEMHWVLLTAGLRGCGREQAAAVEKVMLSVLEGLCKNGVSREDIDAAVLSVDFSQREVRRVHGPYSLVLMRRCLRGWLYDRPPYLTISNRAAFAGIKERIEKEPDYVVGLLSRLLLENRHRSRLTVYPDPDYALSRQAEERRLARELMGGTTVAAVEERHRRLVEFQQEGGGSEDASILPHLSPRELSTDVDKITVRRRTGPGGVPVFVSKEATNGVVYVQLGFPVDVLEPEDYPLLPFLAGSLTNVGFGNTGWVEAARRSALETGGMGASLFTSSMMNEFAEARGYDEVGQPLEDVVFGRDWLFFKTKLLVEQGPAAFALMKETVLTVDFSDAERLATLLKEYRNDFVASLVPNGNEYAASRSSRHLSRNKAVDEIWTGLSQLAAVTSLVGRDMVHLGQQLQRLFERIRGAGAVAHITADEESLDATLPLLESLIADCGFTPPSALSLSPDNRERLMALTELVGQMLGGEGRDGVVSGGNAAGSAVGGDDLELLPGDFQVGFAAASCRGWGYRDKNFVYQELLAHWLTNTALWEQIRTVGGAYGAFAWPDVPEGVFSFATYRDPKPLRSLRVFRQVVERAAAESMDEEELERVITGCYSKEVQPKSPSSRGSVGFLRYLYGYSHEAKKSKLERLLTARPEDVREAACGLLAAMDASLGRAAIVNGKEINQDELKDWKNIRQVGIIGESTR